MSAFVVQPKHIDFLLSYANERGLKFHEVELGRIIRTYNASINDDLDALGRVLTAVNVASVNYRYRENEKPPAYNFRHFRMGSLGSPVQVLTACDCYDYQSCELPEYGQTFALEIINTIRNHAITRLPGYDSALWEVTAA